MKKVVLNYLVFAALAVSTVFSSRTANAGQISMTVKPYKGDAGFRMSGNGTITIDWGDGTENEKHTLEPYEQYHWTRGNVEKYTYRRAYSDTLARIITIIGENITHLHCNSLLNLYVSKNPALIWLYCGWDIYIGDKKMINVDGKQLTSLDVSKNTALEMLHCHNHQLTDLDVSKNTVLKILACSGNQLKNLDVSKNTALQTLYCDNNQLTSLDVRNNTALVALHCNNNQLDSSALNTLFVMLHGYSLDVKVAIIHDNPGTDTCNPNIATNKGWKVELTEEYLFRWRNQQATYNTGRH